MRALVTLLGLLLLAGVAVADKSHPNKAPRGNKAPPADKPAPPAPAEKPPVAEKVEPWEKDVSEADQAKANALFAEANSLFAEKAHPAALEKYKAAIALWDHPMIRFNMAVTLIRLDRMLEAAAELEQALRYGATPFTPELYEQALDYQTLVNKQLGFVEVTCKEPGAHILLDGKRWFDGPGTKQMHITSGEHSIVGEKNGFITVAKRVVVAGGTTAKESVQMFPLESAMVIEYKHPRWMPWTFGGIGAAAAGAGIALFVMGSSELDQFTTAFTRECPTGCELSMHQDLADQQDKALMKKRIGESMMLGGGAIVVTGIIWGVTNRRTRKIGPHMEVAPTAGGASATASWSF
jgi:hypothetical protein